MLIPFRSFILSCLVSTALAALDALPSLVAVEEGRDPQPTWTVSWDPVGHPRVELDQDSRHLRLVAEGRCETAFGCPLTGIRAGTLEVTAEIAGSGTFAWVGLAVLAADAEWESSAWLTVADPPRDWADGQWHRLSGRVVVPPGMTQGKLHLGVNGTGSIRLRMATAAWIEDR